MREKRRRVGRDGEALRVRRQRALPQGRPGERVRTVSATEARISSDSVLRCRGGILDFIDWGNGAMKVGFLRLRQFKIDVFLISFLYFSSKSMFSDFL